MKLRIGIVGAGRISNESHLPVYKSLKGVEIVGICDQQISAAKDTASRFGVNTVFSDISEMVEKNRPDVVDICTPPRTHASLAIKAMEAGCHVLTEKPMATSVKDAEEMITSSEKNSVRLCVVHQNLCNPAVIKARKLIESGILGDPLNVYVQTFEMKGSEAIFDRNHWSHALPGGIFYEILPHPIYLLQSFLKDATVVQVSSKKLGNSSSPKDELRAMVENKNGFGGILVTCNSLIHGDTLDIIGTRRAVTVDLWGRTVLVSRPHTLSAFSVGMSNLHLSMQSLKVIGSTLSTFSKSVFSPIRASAHYGFISSFVDSIVNDTKAPTTGEDGRETVRMLETICGQI
jgi:predicted dehydrogenase